MITKEGTFSGEIMGCASVFLDALRLVSSYNSHTAEV